MGERRRRFTGYTQDEPLELGELLGTQDQAEGYAEYDPAQEPHYSDLYDTTYEEEYSEYHEQMDSDSRFRMAMGAFDLFSVVAGVLVILMLMAMLVTLLSWLQSDIRHSVLLIQSGLQ